MPWSSWSGCWLPSSHKALPSATAIARVPTPRFRRELSGAPWFPGCVRPLRRSPGSLLSSCLLARTCAHAGFAHAQTEALPLLLRPSSSHLAFRAPLRHPSSRKPCRCPGQVGARLLGSHILRLVPLEHWLRNIGVIGTVLFPTSNPGRDLRLKAGPFLSSKSQRQLDRC